MTREEALEKVRREFAAADVIFNEAPSLEGEFGWVFSYQSRDFHRTGDFSDALIGNGPVLVGRKTGRLTRLSSGVPAEVHIENLVQRGDPFAFPGDRLQLIRLATDRPLIQLMSLLRECTDLGVVEARRVLRACEEGLEPTVTCPDSQAATRLAADLRAAGCEVVCLPQNA